MLQIRTIIQNEIKFLDLYQNEPVFLSLSFAELQDITKKNSAFSKAFSLPGSKKNNEIFNFFYDLNAIPTTFDPNNKFEAALLWDGYELFQGHIRLNGVTIANGEIIYQCTFYNQIGDLMANVGDKYLFDLDLNYLSHPYSDEVILYSNYDPNLFPLTGSTNYSYQNGKTMWGLYNIGYDYLSGTTLNYEITPLLQFTTVDFSSGVPSYVPLNGTFDFSGTPVHDYYFKPTIQIRELYEAILREAGYQLDSSFMDTAYFKRYYMPLKFVDETIYARNAVIPCYTFTNSNLYTTSGSSITDPTIPSYVNPISGLTCNTLGLTGTTTTLNLPEQYAGSYQTRITFKATPSFECDYYLSLFPGAALYFNDGTIDVPLYSNSFCDGLTTQVSFDQTFNFTGDSTFSFYFLGEYVSITDFEFQIISAPRFIPTGSTINYDIEFPDNDYTQLDFLTSINKYFNLLVIPNPDDPKKLIVEPIVDYVGKGRVLDWTTKIDFNSTQNLYPTTSLVNGTLQYEFKLDQDYANQDFKTQTNRVFGTDKFKLNLEYKDDTTMFTYLFSSPIDITVSNSYVPLITLQSMSKVKTIDKSGSTQQTFVPFKILPKVIFRGLTLPNDNYGFVGLTATTQTVCSSGITFNITASQLTVPLSYYDCFGQQTILYLGTGSYSISGCADPNSVSIAGPIFPPPTLTITSTGTTCSNITSPGLYQYWYMDQYQQDRWSNLNRFTTYPFAFTGFSHYINYRGEDKTNITPSEFSFNSQDLYNIYYEDYVDDIISEENKIYAAKIYLYPQDVQGLRFNEKILINNTYFRINRITNFNALEPGICDIELVKLTRDYQSHPVLYYDLIPCSTGDTLYSNSDLMFNLFAYSGNYVKLYDDNLNYLGCYNVSIGQYDSTRTYNHYWLSDGYSANLVGVYPNCGCTGRTQFNIIQEEPGTPRLFTYIGTGCTDLETYIFRSNEYQLSGGNYSYSITNTATTESICVYNVETYFSQLTDWIEEDLFLNCEACEISFITPTPTATVGATPTPTPTRLLSDCLCMEIIITSEAGPEGGRAGSISYNDCYGNYVARVFRAPGTYYQCVQEFDGIPQIVLSDGEGSISIYSSCNTGECPPPASPTPTPSFTSTPSPTPTIGTTPSNTPTNTQTQTPTPTTTSASTCPETIYTYGNLRPNCSDYCTTNYNINTIDNSTQPYGTLTIGDFICGYEGETGYLAYSNVSTDTNTGPFKIADIDGTGEVVGIYVCVGGSCVPL